MAVVIAALNEEATDRGVLADIPDVLCGLPVRVLVVDDGSTDSTAEVARVAGALVYSHSRNLGQGDGLRTGHRGRAPARCRGGGDDGRRRSARSR